MLNIEISELELLARGKVRDVYNFRGDVLVIATDRLSAFDRPLGVGIPGRGRVLTGLTVYWFDMFSEVIGNYMISAALPEGLERYREILEGRTMLAKRVSFFPVEFVVRGYLYGSAWRDYRERGEVCGLRLEPGMVLGERFSEPFFTPAQKVQGGHDINITEEECFSIIGRERGRRLEEVSLEIFCRASSILEAKGIILADTKIEFGLLGDTEVLVNELLTPDCSRFWLKEKYEPGRALESMDKQPLRDYLESRGWAGDGPPPDVPGVVLERMSEAYRAIYRAVTGKDV